MVGCVNVEPQSTISDQMAVIFQNIFQNIDVIDSSNHLSTNYEQLLFSNCTRLTNISPMCVKCKTFF